MTPNYQVQIQEWEMLYDRYGGALYSLVRQKIEDIAIAESIFEKAIRLIFENWNEHDPSKTTRFCWMRIITIRQINEAIEKMNPPSPAGSFQTGTPITSAI